MTFSVAGRDPRTGDIGVAVASKFLAVDALVPFVKSGVGAVATQSYVNPNFGPDGLALAGGRAPQDVAAHFQAQGTDIGQRQFGLVDLQGRSATLTGGDGHAWAGSWAGPDVAIQGNLLAGPEVVDAMRAAWEAGDTQPLPHPACCLPCGPETRRAATVAGGSRRPWCAPGRGGGTRA